MMQWLAQLSELPAVLLNAVLGVVVMLDTIPLVGLLIPADVAVLAVVGAQEPIGGWGVMLAVVFGCLAGWSMTFAAGRFFGTRIRRSRFGAWIGESRWAAAERMVARGGGRMLVAAPFLPVLNTLMPLAAGGLRMPYRRFVLSAALGATLWGAVYVALGSIARVVSHLLPGDSYVTVGTVVLGTIIGSVAMLGMRRRLGADEVSDGAAVAEPVAEVHIGHAVPVRPAVDVRIVRRIPVRRRNSRPVRSAQLVPTQSVPSLFTPLLLPSWRRSAAPGLSRPRGRQPDRRRLRPLSRAG
jgi:membrane protein DedA with SNARE-associated domain